MSATLHVTIQEHIARRNQLLLEMSNLQDQKRLATYERGDVQALKNSERAELKAYFKALYEADPTLQENYKDYTEIPEFEDELDKLTAKYNEELDELSAWETELETRITTDSAEEKEIQAFLDSWKEKQSSNIQEEFSFGLNN